MAGKHEPPTSWSFYLDLAASTLRALLVVALVVAGVLGLTRLFPEGNVSRGVTPTGTGPAPTTTTRPSPTGTKPTGSPTPTRSPRVEGVTILVLNGTSTAGLAASTSAVLENAGYDLAEPGNAPAQEITIIYYHEGYDIEANALKEKFFNLGTTSVREAPPEVPAEVNIEVILGEDFAAADTPTSSPTA